MSTEFLDIVGSFNTDGPKLDLLAYKDDGSDEAAERDGSLLEGLADRVEFAAEDEAVEEVEGVEESEEKTDPNTRFAFSRVASFSNASRIREGLFGSRGTGWGRSSNGTKSAGNRVIWI